MTTASDFDWEGLARLRDAFLRGTAGQEDYWNSETDLVAYDATFAQRIGWKWDFVLEDLRQLGWSPPPGELVDWGCGTGIAARACLDHFGAEAFWASASSTAPPRRWTLPAAVPPAGFRVSR